MVHNLTLNQYQSNMSINSSESIDSPTSSSDVEGTSFQDVPLVALTSVTRKKLSYLLNSKKIIRSEEGYERDWRGLAYLAKQKSMCDESSISGDDPMSKVINLWCNNNPTTATFGNLETYLGKIDRWDVCDDIYENLVADTKIYRSKPKQLSLDPVIDTNANFGHDNYQDILTLDDVSRAQKGLPPQRYDAFVLYAELDQHYVLELIKKLEDNPEYNLKLCFKDRLVGGVAFQHVALTELIEDRCKYLIVILTTAFLKSAENVFLVDYTQARQIEHKTRKIIPIIYESNIDIPRTLNIYTLLHYNSSPVGLCNFWTKLANSIRNVEKVVVPEIRLPNHRHTTNSLLDRKDMSKGTQEKFKNNTVTNFQIRAEPYATAEHIANPKAETLRRNRYHQERVKGGTTVLRHAHSTSQLQASPNYRDAVDIANISATSDSKKKKKWSKLLKVFSRSTTKLQTS